MIKEYVRITKPGIIVGNLITAIAGFFIGTKKQFDYSAFLAMLFGLSLIIGSGCVFNNYKDRFIDQKMRRTQIRALVQGTISEINALRFGSVLIALSIVILTIFTNTLALISAIFGFIIYVYIYTPLKLRSRHSTLIGSLAGAIPPVVGYSAASHSFDLCSLILFFMILSWQMPHFYAIAMYRSQDYKQAEIPVLPLVKGFFRTKLQMLYYTVLFFLNSLLLYYFNYTGKIYFFTVLALGSLWLLYAIKGLSVSCDITWAKKMFKISLLVVMGLSTALMMNHL